MRESTTDEAQAIPRGRLVVLEMPQQSQRAREAHNGGIVDPRGLCSLAIAQQPNNNTPTNTMTGLIRLMRTVSQGVSRLPDTVCSAIDVPARTSAMSKLPNCTKPASADAPVMTMEPI